jgi:predicted MPP superfamily phosphohydrolase
MLGFFLFIVGLSVALHLRIAQVLTAPFLLTPGAHRFAIGVALLLASGVPATFLLMRFAGQRWADRLAVLGWLWMGIFSLLALPVLLWDVVGALRWGVEAVLGRELVDPERRLFLSRIVSGTILGGGTVAALWGFANTRRLAEIVRVRVPIEGLHPSLHGFRIAQISDIHVGAGVDAGRVRAIVDAVNGLDADLVAVTGDLVDGPVDGLVPHVEPIRELRARHGAWFVTGNHEYYSGALAWCWKAAELGLRVLNDAHQVVLHDGATVVVAGITDRFSPRKVPEHRSDPRIALSGAPEGDLRLLLAHQPKCIDKTPGLGVHLQLSGHTHAGQYAPYTWLIHFAQEFVSGLYRVGPTWLYVNRGTTWWGPPLRMGASQEITLLTLVPA